MRPFLIGILAIFIVSCTNTTESVDEKISLEFSTGINLPEFNIHLEKINELIRGYDIIKDTTIEGIPYNEDIPLLDQIKNSPIKNYFFLDEFYQDYPFYRYFTPNFGRKGKIINSPILGYAKVSDTSIVNNYIHKFADSIELSRPYNLEWNHLYHLDDWLFLTIFEFENNSRKMLDDKLIKSIYYKPSGFSNISKFRSFLSKLKNPDSYELIIEFEQPLLNRLSFEKSVPILFTYKFNIIEYSKSFTLNELIDNNYQVSISDKIPRDELVLLKSKYDLTKNKL